MNPAISIIIPVFNAANYIEKCLQSIADQLFNNFEVILIDDGSTDDSVGLINKFIRDRSRWNVYAQPNSGPSSARNTGITYATGEYTAFVDADDYVEPDYLLQLYNSITLNDAGLACCGYFDHSKYGVLELSNYSAASNATISVFEFIDLIFSNIGGVLWDKIFKTDIIKIHAIRFKNDVFMCEDLLFLLDYVRFINKIFIYNKPLYHYNRLTESSISKHISVTYMDNIVSVNKQVIDKLKKIGYPDQQSLKIVSKNVSNFVLGSILNLNTQKSISHNKGLIKTLLDDEFINKAYKPEAVQLMYKPYLIFIKLKSINLILLYTYLLRTVSSIYKR